MAFISESMQHKLDPGDEQEESDPMGETVYALQMKKKARQSYLRKLMLQGGYGDLLTNQRIGAEHFSEEDEQ